MRGTEWHRDLQEDAVVVGESEGGEVASPWTTSAAAGAGEVAKMLGGTRLLGKERRDSGDLHGPLAKAGMEHRRRSKRRRLMAGAREDADDGVDWGLLRSIPSVRRERESTRT
jgi:hypothetical protein